MRLASVAVILLIARPLWADTYPRPDGFHVTHYDFAVTLGDANNDIAMRETLSFRITRDNVQQIALDLCQPRTRAEPADHSNPCLPRQPYGAPKTALAPAAGTGMQVTAVEEAGGTSLHFTQAHDRLIVTLTPPGRSGEERQVTIAYHGVPANGLLIGYNR
jgi:hypothetical protein